LVKRFAVKQLAQRLVQSELAQNAAALYGVQFVRKLLPLLIVPYLARVLGPAGWGLVAFMQSLAEIVVLGIEFGFNLSATREIARHRESKETCGEIMAGVLGAQAVLALVGISAAAAISSLIPVLRENPWLVAAGLFYAIAQGFIPLWFFQGLERMRLAAMLEIAGRTAGLLAVFVFVRSAQDTWVALAIQGVAPAITTCAGLCLAYRAIPCRTPTYWLVRGALARGWPLFVFRSAESLYGVANAFILGLFAAPAQVGYFASAEKISRATFGLLNPIRETLYPRISNLAHHSPERAATLARTGGAIMVGSGLMFSMAVYGFAPQLIGLLMGQAFGPAITVLRILSALPLVLAVTHSVGLQWLLPFGRDAEVNRIVVAAGVLNLVLAMILAPHFTEVGMACSVLSAEVFVCVSMLRATLKSPLPAAPVEDPVYEQLPVDDFAS
jgi:PST family polysaccharide transporter